MSASAKKISLVWYLFRSYFGLITLTLIIVVLLSFKLIYDNSVQFTKNQLITNAILVEELVLKSKPDMSQVRFEAYVDQLASQIESRITFIELDGDVLFDTLHVDAELDNHANRPEIQDAIQLGKGISLRYSSTYGDTLLYYAVRLKVPGHFDGVLRLSVPIVFVQSSLWDIGLNVLIGALLTILCAGFLVYSFSKQFTRLIKDVNRMAVAFSRKERFRLPNTHSREMERLVGSVMKMGEYLNNRIERVSRIKDEQALLLQNMVESVVMVDLEGKVTIINEAACELLGKQRDDVIGAEISVFAKYLPTVKSFMTRTLGQNEVLEEECEISSSPLQVLLFHGVPLDHDDERMGYLFVAQDISNIKQLERVRKDFVANVSHELKTPITLIKGAVETLIQGAMNDEKHRDQFLKIILRHSDRLAAIIDDLLQLSKLEGGLQQYMVDYEENDLYEIVDATVEALQENASKKSIQIQYPADGFKTPIWCNRSLIQQALGNLIGNAIKYSPEETHINVEVKTDENRVMMYVKDQGGGIPEEHHEKLFQRFYRIDKARSRDMGGTGLGLSIVKHIAESHGGEVGMFSIPGGSCFWIELPIQLGHLYEQNTLFE